jgi:hypothetical protein
MLHPAALPRGPLCKRLGVPQGQSGWVWKIFPVPGIDPQTLQPVLNCCMGYSTLCNTMPVQNFLDCFRRLFYGVSLEYLDRPMHVNIVLVPAICASSKHKQS